MGDGGARPRAGSGTKAGIAMRPSGRSALCVCGHRRCAHRHYRRGSDCGLCECVRWRRETWLRRLFAGKRANGS
jgi:hypothetical protein